MAILNVTTSATPQVNLAAAQSPSSLAQRQRAQERINRIWHKQTDYFVAIDDDLSLENLAGDLTLLAVRVQHMEIPDDRYTVFVTAIPRGWKYDCQLPSIFQKPVVPIVIALVAAAYERRVIGKWLKVAR